LNKKKQQSKSELLTLTNIGPAMLRDLNSLNIHSIRQLAQANPDSLYLKLEKITGKSQDLCVWDVFAAAVHEAKTGEQTVWWAWTPVRKKRQAAGKFCKK